MTEYIDFDVAIKLAGLTLLDVNDANLQEAIVNYVENLSIDAVFGRDFLMDEITTSNPELHNIGENQNTIITKHFPIISVTRLRTNIRATVSSSVLTLTEHTNFEIDKNAGLIHLIIAEEMTDIMKTIEYFVEGYNSTDVCYTYGYLTPPSDIIAYANIMAAKILRAYKNWEIDVSSNTISLTMGDYTEKVSDWARQMNDVYDTILNKSLLMLLNKYANLT